MKGIKSIFSVRLRALRLAKGLTQKQLAEILKVNVSTISRWENIKIIDKNT